MDSSGVQSSCHVTSGYHNGFLVQQAPAPAGAHVAELATQRAPQDSHISAFPATSSLSAFPASASMSAFPSSSIDGLRVRLSTTRPSNPSFHTSRVCMTRVKTRGGVGE